MNNLISDFFVSQVISQDVLKLVTSDALIFDISDELLPDQSVLDIGLKNLSASLNCLVLKSIDSILVVPDHQAQSHFITVILSEVESFFKGSISTTVVLELLDKSDFVFGEDGHVL